MSNISRTYIVGKVTKAQARNALKRDHKPRRKRMEPWRMNALQRRSECRKVAHSRRHAPGGLGGGLGWAWVIGNYVRILNNQITAQLLRDEVEALGLPPIDPPIISQVVSEIGGKAWGEYRLYSPEIAGANLALLACERDECGITKIDAVDELAEERTKRLARERKAEERAAKAAARPPKITKASMARALGVHRATIDRWIAEGRLDPETGELREDATHPVTLSNTSPSYFVRDPVTKSVASPEIAA